MSDSVWLRRPVDMRIIDCASRAGIWEAVFPDKEFRAQILRDVAWLQQAFNSEVPPSPSNFGRIG